MSAMAVNVVFQKNLTMNVARIQIEVKPSELPLRNYSLWDEQTLANATGLAIELAGGNPGFVA
ncbi:hypothetical protein [Phaeobacter italicus]|uniref:hypothetical protein n=1 Tax=Phaeobacter italicus TaxID=481446 RepID=UPI001CD73191|nr:hypothetical protein [Phaeobacter italicus]MCA0855530.1 hypothetical protein [Phaeobacter italicus]